MNLLAGVAVSVDTRNEEEVARSIQEYVIVASPLHIDSILWVA